MMTTLWNIQWRIAARKGALKSMPEHDRALESRKASVRAKVEHPFLIVTRDFGIWTGTKDTATTLQAHHRPPKPPHDEWPVDQ